MTFAGVDPVDTAPFGKKGISGCPSGKVVPPVTIAITIWLFGNIRWKGLTSAVGPNMFCHKSVA